MLYIHRGKLKSDILNAFTLPINFDYMGASEFEHGGVGKSFRYLAEHAHETIVAHNQYRVRRRDYKTFKSYWDTIDLWAMGTRDQVDKTLEQLKGYYQSNRTVRSKEYIDFGYVNGDLFSTQHDIGVEINNHVFLTVHRGFAMFIQDYVSVGEITRPSTTQDRYQIGDFVVFYDLNKDRVDLKAMVCGIPEDDQLITVKSRKKKQRVRVNQVLPANGMHHAHQITGSDRM